MMTSVAMKSSPRQSVGLGGNYNYVPLQDMSTVPPPAGYYPAPTNQSSNTNVVTVDQPQPAPVHVPEPVDKPNPAMFIVSIILMSTCIFGAFPLCICVVPAVIFSAVGFNYGHSKSAELRQQSKVFAKVALGLNIAAVVFFVLIMVIAAISYGVSAGYILKGIRTGFYH